MVTSRVLHRVEVGLTADLAVPAGVRTPIPWTLERFDTDGYHDLVTNPTRLTIPPFFTGWYFIGVQLLLELQTGDVAARTLDVSLNGAANLIHYEAVNHAAAAAQARVMQWSKIIYLATTDYIEVGVTQNQVTSRLCYAAGLLGSYCQLMRLGAG